MKRFFLSICLCLTGYGGLPAGAQEPPAESAAATLPAEPFALKARWKNGLYFYSDDGLFVIQPGGRMQFDTVFMAMPSSLRHNIPGPTPFEDGVTMRRARFAMDGTIFKTIDFKSEFDFANAFITQTAPQRESDVVVPTELNLTFRELPGIGNLRVGNQKQPISFEHITSSKYLNFLERSTSFDAFAEGFNNGFTMGAQIFDNFLVDKRGYWALGIFKNTRSVFGYNVGRNESDLTGRFVVLPVYECQGETLLHLGVGGSYRDLDQNQQRYRSRLGVRSSPSALADLIADTGLITGSRESRIVPEFVGVHGPFSFQSEYYLSWLTEAVRLTGPQAVPVGTTFFHGGYVEMHYFLTGEHREYDHERMAFTRVTPKNPLRWTGPSRGTGAWQVALRYGYLDLDNNGIAGGTTHELAAGLNWFLNPNAKIQANYVLTYRNAVNPNGEGFINGFGIRTAWDF